jgi:hypothetical protein
MFGMPVMKIWGPQVPFWDLGNYKFMRPQYWLVSGG